MEYPLHTGGVDFDNTPRDLMFPAGETSSCVAVDIFSDSIIEIEERFKVIIINVSGNIIIPDNDSTVVTITDVTITDGKQIIYACLPHIV